MSHSTNITQKPATPGHLIAGLSLSYLIGIGLMTILVISGGIWNQLANSRILSLLIEGGVVRYHDKQIGPIAGVLDLKYYVMSQDPVGWWVALVAVALMFGYWFVKALQFHLFAREMGGDQKVSNATKAYLYGQGVNRWMPFNFGDLAAAKALSAESDAQNEDQVTGTVYLSRCMTFFEIAFFGLIGLFLIGWGDWTGLLFWPLVIFAASFFLIRFPGTWRGGLDHVAGRKLVFSWLRDRPLMAFGVALLSIIAFMLEHVAIYALSQAFSSANVLLNIDFSVFMMALVAGMIARAIPITPGGLGQFEWGFAIAIYLSGTGMPEAVTVALLFAVLRYGVGFALTAGIKLFQGLPISMRNVLDGVRVSS